MALRYEIQKVNNATNRILVVDDEPRIRELTRMVLENEGYRVAVASDGVEAIEKSLVEAPDLVLLDLKLPKMDGFKACKAIKSQSSRARSTPVIAFTVLDVDRKLIDEVGFDGYFKKPFAPEELVREVRKYLEGSKI